MSRGYRIIHSRQVSWLMDVIRLPPSRFQWLEYLQSQSAFPFTVTSSHRSLTCFPFHRTPQSRDCCPTPSGFELVYYITIQFLYFVIILSIWCFLGIAFTDTALCAKRIGTAERSVTYPRLRKCADSNYAPGRFLSRMYICIFNHILCDTL